MFFEYSWHEDCSVSTSDCKSELLGPHRSAYISLGLFDIGVILLFLFITWVNLLSMLRVYNLSTSSSFSSTFKIYCIGTDSIGLESSLELSEFSDLISSFNGSYFFSEPKSIPFTNFDVLTICTLLTWAYW